MTMIPHYRKYLVISEAESVCSEVEDLVYIYISLQRGRFMLSQHKTGNVIAISNGASFHANAASLHSNGISLRSNSGIVSCQRGIKREL